MRNRQKNFMVDFIFTLSLFGVFAVSALLVVVIGAGVYRSTVSLQESNAVHRTSLAYVAEKIRQGDESGSIRAGEIEGEPALILTSVYGGESYSTYIYSYEGKLRELFAKSSSVPSLIAGQAITEVSAFEIEEAKDGLYRIAVSDAEQDSLEIYVNTMST